MTVAEMRFLLDSLHDDASLAFQYADGFEDDIEPVYMVMGRRVVFMPYTYRKRLESGEITDLRGLDLPQLDDLTPPSA